jgi:hypothetical protein
VAASNTFWVVALTEPEYEIEPAMTTATIPRTIDITSKSFFI